MNARPESRLRRRLLVSSVAAVMSVALLPARAGDVRLETDGMVIQSRASTIDLESGHRHHEGNVRAKHLNLRLWSDELEEFRAEGELVKVLARGKPARFRQLPPLADDVSHGVAARAEYLPAKRRLTLWDYTVTDVDGNVMKGGKVVYLLKAQ